MYVMNYLYLFIFFNINLCAYIYADRRVFTIETDTSVMTTKTCIKYAINNQQIGFINYFKIPCFPVYIIHTFYIYPSYRNKGYGRELISYALFRLKKKKVSKIYIQPGPSEIKNDSFRSIVNDNERINKTKKLVNFYNSLGFVPVNKFFSNALYFFYKVFKISENPRDLMVMNRASSMRKEHR